MQHFSVFPRHNCHTLATQFPVLFPGGKMFPPQHAFIDKGGDQPICYRAAKDFL
jgi:hypothetical protein